MFNADLALSVTMTAISTILSCVALPANLLLYANISYNADVTKDLDWMSVFVALAIVISAIALGLYCSYSTHSYRFNMIANKGKMILVLFDPHSGIVFISFHGHH
jgi:predicted Na+-dependent transporter